MQGIAKIFKTMDIEIYDWKNCKEHAEVYKFVMAVQDQVKSRNLRYFKPQVRFNDHDKVFVSTCFQGFSHEYLF